ncbi:unnamed protein product [Closterium sp. NIES-54]
MGHFIPTNATALAKATARLFFDRIITIHSIPATLISDRDPKFTSSGGNSWARSPGGAVSGSNPGVCTCRPLPLRVCLGGLWAHKPATETSPFIPMAPTAAEVPTAETAAAVPATALGAGATAVAVAAVLLPHLQGQYLLLPNP